MADGGGGDSGQASVEHAALALLVTIVLGAATAIAGGLGAGVVNAVHSGLRRALCVAGGDRCAAFHDERPCVVRREQRAQGATVSALFLRVGARVGVLREVGSDGRTTVTVHDDVDAGAQMGVGAQIPFGGSRIDLAATAGGGVRGGWGRSWTLGQPEDADRLLRTLLGGRDGPRATQGVGRGLSALVGSGGLPVPDAEGLRLGQERSLRAKVDAPGGLDLTAELLGQGEVEALLDRRRGRYVLALGLEPDLLGRLTGPLDLELGGRLAGDVRVEVELDRDRRPLELRLLGALRTADGTHREQAELRVDLTRPQVGEALRALMRAARGLDPGAATRAASTLGRWAVSEGAIERRAYRVDERSEDRGFSLALGVKLGYGTTTTSERWQLERATTRPPGGVWEARIDCVAG